MRTNWCRIRRIPDLPGALYTDNSTVRKLPREFLGLAPDSIRGDRGTAVRAMARRLDHLS
jgi:hypothetical protein